MVIEVKDMKGLFKNSNDTFSDDASISNRRLTNSNTLNVEENDDINEKRAKRKSMINENLSTKIIIPNKKINLSSDNIDIGSHYGNCIKLASTGKINATNAFSLHLIDYLSEYVKELSHFQTVGSSLDAGTKIYAVRVDSVFTNTYQVLTGLGNPGDDKSSGNNDGNNDGYNDDEMNEVENELSDNDNDKTETKQKKTKRKNNLAVIKNTIAQNYKKIRINPSQIRNEIDPLFQCQAENFDEGDICELRLNNLRILDSSFELALDSEKIVVTNAAGDDGDGDLLLGIAGDGDGTAADPFDVSSFVSMFRDLCEGNVAMCEQFEDFTFCGWQEGSEIMNSTTAESFRNMMQTSELAAKLDDNGVPDAPIYEPMDDFVADDYHDNAANNLEFSEITRENNNNKNEEFVKIEEEDDNLVTIVSNKTDNCAGEVLMSSVRDMVSSIVEQYGEVNDNILGMWAGPNYWKQKAKPIKTRRIDTERKPVSTKPPKELKPIFPEKIETRLNEDGIGRMILNVDWKFTKNEKLSTQLTDICLNKNIYKDYLLPPRTQFSFKSINQLMNREVSLVNKAIKKQTESLQRMDLTEDDKILNYDHNVANDVLEVQSVTLVTDDIGNITVNQEGFDDGFGNMPEDDLSDTDAYTGTLFHTDFDAVDQDPVTANVRHIEQIDIDYAKAAKRFDVKNLKTRMWSILQNLIGAVDVKTIYEMKYPDLCKSTRTCLFSELLVSLNAQLTLEQSKDLSVPILLTCLLHLANETGLDIGNTEDYNDLVIGQGYSDYDIEQIKEFGVGNCLLNNSRKRNSAGCSGDTKKRKKKSIFLSEDDDEYDN